jgi:FKBP-type peptidyl-prolyl cis-trans isomerase SlyD
MLIENDCVVTFHYRLSDVAGEVIEDSHGAQAMAYLHGHGNIIEGLERALAGRVAGDSFSITLPPEQAYGLRRDDAVRRIPKKAVLTKGKLVAGQSIMVNSQHGPRQVRVVKPGKFMVDVDMNHPLAGVTLSFAVEVEAVRAATAEELAHGHVHGPGGHQH